MSAIQFREGTARDRDGVLALRALAFAGEDPEKMRPQFWEWEYRRGDGGPGRFFVAQSGTEIVGHIGAIPRRFQAERPLRVWLFADAMVHPHQRRKGVLSRLLALAVEHLRIDADLLMAYSVRPQVTPAMLQAGFRVMADIPVLLRLPNLPRRVSREVIRPLHGHEYRSLDAFLATEAVRQPRSDSFVRWRYTETPYWPHRLLGLFENESLRAFVSFRDTTLRRIPSRAVSDCGFARGEEDRFRTLLRHVCATPRLGAAFFSEAHPARGLLEQSGFFAGPHRFHLLMQAYDESMWRQAASSWSLSWGDTDHL